MTWTPFVAKTQASIALKNAAYEAMWGPWGSSFVPKKKTVACASLPGSRILDISKMMTEKTTGERYIYAYEKHHVMFKRMINDLKRHNFEVHRVGGNDYCAQRKDGKLDIFVSKADILGEGDCNKEVPSVDFLDFDLMSELRPSTAEATVRSWPFLNKSKKSILRLTTIRNIRKWDKRSDYLVLSKESDRALRDKSRCVFDSRDFVENPSTYDQRLAYFRDRVQVPGGGLPHNRIVGEQTNSYVTSPHAQPMVTTLLMLEER
jgi:hypothetical protein